MSDEYDEESSVNEEADNHTNFVERGRQQVPGAAYESSDYDAEQGSPSEDGYGAYNGNGFAGGGSVPRTKVVKNTAYQEEWVEEEEEEEEQGDDPRDADFEPGSPQASVSQQEDDEEEYNESAGEEDYDDYENGGMSNESEDDYGFVRPGSYRKRPTTRVGLPDSNKRRKVMRSSEMDFSDSEEEDVPKRQALGPRLTARINTEAPVPRYISKPEPTNRRARRSVTRKTYVEEEEDDDDDDEDDEDDPKPKKVAKTLEEVDEDELDRIERVLWHQPKGLAAAAIEQGTIPVPYVINTDPCAEIDWDNQEFYIKWKGQSHLHCQWLPLPELSQLVGFKKVVNYMKRVEDDRLRRMALAQDADAAEIHDVNKEMELDFLKQCVQVERVVSDRVSNIDGEEVQEYLVKWKGLNYAESSWERDTSLHFAQDLIDEYKEREANSYTIGKSAESQRSKQLHILRKVDVQPEWLKGGQLRDYQLEGLNFLLNCWRKNINLILADEMGLGKTVQSVSMLGYLQNSLDIVGPFLVIVPLSTIANWAKEFRKWLPNMNVIIYVGDRASRQLIRKYEFETNIKSRPLKFNTLVTTYEVLMKDKEVLSRFRWDYMMVDEAHRLKNSGAQLYSTLMDFHAKNRVLITGTPLQNSVDELWALLHFLEPQKFRVKQDFVDRYKSLTTLEKPKLASSVHDTEPALLESLHAELAPHMLRRVIKDVEKSLPPKIERILRVEMTPLQKQYYKWILNRNFTDLNKGVKGKQVSLLNIVCELKKCCNHPFLFESADHGYNAPKLSDTADKVERIALSSGKLVLLDKLLVRLRATGHRVLIFSQMVKMLDILAEYLALRGFQFQRLDGTTKYDLRMQAMEHFNAPGSEDFCFLLSTRAGGLGINLATADTVIIFDSDWNPQNDLQAMSRAHRIGQKDTVNVYRFVTSKSVEEDILERAKKKMVLDHLVIQKLNKKGKKESGAKPGSDAKKMFDKNELAAILRFGAEELFKESQEEAETKLKNLNIDEILERAEKVTGDDAADGNELLGAFKVANFSQSSDDVAFWTRLLPGTKKEEEDLEQGRRSRNVKTLTTEESGRYGRRRGSLEKPGRRRPARAEPMAPRIEGAAAQVSTWDGGRLSKRDASAFVKGVKRFGDQSRLENIIGDISAISEASEEEQLQLYESLIEGCTEAVNTAYNAKAAILDFFGVSVRAQELLARVKELTVLGKRIKRHQDPVSQFRLRSHPRNPSWSKSSGWNQVDDARLLLGVYYHGAGNWEKIKADATLGLTKKISLESIPKATHLEARVNQLLRKELELDNDPKSRKRRGQDDDDDEGGPSKQRANARERAKPTGTRKSARNINREAAAAAAASAKQESEDDKEEGEISVSDEEAKRAKKKVVEDKDREQRWLVWCEGVMSKDMDTLRLLESLSESKDVSNKEVVKRVKAYLKKLGGSIDGILKANADGKCSLEKMEIRLWNYVAKFSDLPGSQLSELYRKLKADGGAEDTSNNSNHGDGNVVSTSKGKDARTYKRRSGRNADEAESWKRRRRQDD